MQLGKYPQISVPKNREAKMKKASRIYYML